MSWAFGIVDTCHVPFWSSAIRMLPSAHAPANILLSPYGAQATLLTADRDPFGLKTWYTCCQVTESPFLFSQMMMLPSNDADARYDPLFGFENATR